jgi:Zn-dependent M16 (insulinase) family peptidase
LFNEADWAAEQLGGVSQVFFQRELLKQMDADWSNVLEKLEQIRRYLVNGATLVANVTLDAGNWGKLRSQLTDFLSRIPTNAAVAAVWTPVRSPEMEGLTIPAQVNYVGKGANLFKLGYQQDGSIDVITKLLGTTWLWERVRVQGGAYGGFVAFSHRTGVLTYLSYRDPNLLGTLENFDRSADFLKSLKLDQAELTKSIIGAIGDMDAYMLPDAKGFVSLQRYLAGETDEFRQEIRDQLLGAEEKDFHELGAVLEKLNVTGNVVVMGSPEALAKANAEMEGKLTITKVL